jgi:thiosulfate reductase cytochrome b subunit
MSEMEAKAEAEAPMAGSAPEEVAAPRAEAPVRDAPEDAVAAVPERPAAVGEAAATAERPAAVAMERPVADRLDAGGLVADGRARAKRPLVKRHHWLVRVTHWANAVLLVGMIGSGLQIYGAFQHFGPRGRKYLPNPWDGKPFPHWAGLGGWLAGGLNWHFGLAWPFVLTGLIYLFYLLFSGEWRSLLFRPSDVPRAVAMQLYYLRLRKEHPPQGKHNALQKAAYTFILVLGAISVLSGFAIYKAAQLWWLTALFGGYELARYWHFWAVFLFVGFILVHVTLVLLVDPASLRAMITGWYRGRFPSHD